MGSSVDAFKFNWAASSQKADSSTLTANASRPLYNYKKLADLPTGPLGLFSCDMASNLVAVGTIVEVTGLKTTSHPLCQATMWLTLYSVREMNDRLGAATCNFKIQHPSGLLDTSVYGGACSPHCFQVLASEAATQSRGPEFTRVVAKIIQKSTAAEGSFTAEEVTKAALDIITAAASVGFTVASMLQLTNHKAASQYFSAFITRAIMDGKFVLTGVAPMGAAGGDNPLSAWRATRPQVLVDYNSELSKQFPKLMHGHLPPPNGGADRTMGEERLPKRDRKDLESKEDKGKGPMDASAKFWCEVHPDTKLPDTFCAVHGAGGGRNGKGTHTTATCKSLKNDQSGPSLRIAANPGLKKLPGPGESLNEVLTPARASTSAPAASGGTTSTSTQ